MRKETQKAVDALLDGKNIKLSRTTVDGDCLMLHGNVIAVVTRYPDGKSIKQIETTLAGWPTVTTRDRLNGLIQGWAHRVTGTYTKAGFSQRKGKQFFTDVKGEVKEITPNETVVINY